MNPLMNALMPGEHDYLRGKPMPGQVAQAPTPMQQQPAQRMLQPQQSEPAKRGGFLGGVGNALSTVFKYGAPEAFEQGRQMKARDTVGNALAGGDYESAAQAALKAGNIDQGLAIRTAGTEQQAAQRQQEAQGVLQLFTTLEPGQVAQYAMEDPQGFERMTGMSADEFTQAGARMRQMGVTPEQFTQMVVQKAQAELGVTPEKPTYFAPTEVLGPDGKPQIAQFSNSGGAPRSFDGMAPYKAPSFGTATTQDGVIAFNQSDPSQTMNLGQSPVRSPLVSVNTGSQAADPYQGIPDGVIISEPPKGMKLGEGQVLVRDSTRPQGVRVDNLTGGAAEAEANAAKMKELGRQESVQRAGRTVVREVGRSLDLMPDIVGWGGKDKAPGETETSTGGGEIASANARLALSKIPGSAENQFMQNIESALSNVGLDRLQEMRENSPTGGALGQVPFQQQQRLEQVLGSFKITMPKPVMEENLKYMNNAYMDIMFGSPDERAELVARGVLSPEDNAQIDKNYYDLNWNKFGRFLPDDKQKRLDELRAKRDAGQLQ